MAVDPTQLKEKSEEMAIVPLKADDLAGFSDLGSRGPVRSNKTFEEPLHPVLKKEASAARNYEERAKEQRIARFIELQKYLDDRQSKKNLRLLFAIQNELDLNIIEKEIRLLESEIAVLEEQLSENQNIEPQIQERKELICSILTEKLKKLELRCTFLDTVYQNSPCSPEKSEWLQNQQLDIHKQTSVKIPEKIKQFGGIPQPEYQTICTPERRKQELEEILIKEKALVLKINLRTLCTELLANLNNSKKQSVIFSFNQKEKEPTSAQKQAFETIKEIARWVKESEWVELQANVDDDIARIQEAIKLLEQPHSKGVRLDIVTKTKKLRLALLKLKNPEEDIKDEVNETPQPTISSCGRSNLSDSSPPLKESFINRGDPPYSDSNNEGPSVLPEKERIEKRDILSSSFSASIVFQTVITFGTELLTSDAAPYKIARGVIITILVLGLAVGITAATCGIVPAALAIGGAIAAHATIAESVAGGLLALGALGVAGFFGKECHKKRDENSFERLSNSKCN